MKKLMALTFSAVAFTTVPNLTFADTPTTTTELSGPSSEQIEKLNTDIQGQLKQLQAQQQGQINKLNSQIQAQITQVQAKLQQQMQFLNGQTQTQLKKMQETLQQQILQVQQQAMQRKG